MTRAGHHRDHTACWICEHRGLAAFQLSGDTLRMASCLLHVGGTSHLCGPAAERALANGRFNASRGCANAPRTNTARAEQPASVVCAGMGVCRHLVCQHGHGGPSAPAHPGHRCAIGYGCPGRRAHRPGSGGRTAAGVWAAQQASPPTVCTNSGCAAPDRRVDALRLWSPGIHRVWVASWRRQRDSDHCKGPCIGKPRTPAACNGSSP